MIEKLADAKKPDNLYQLSDRKNTRPWADEGIVIKEIKTGKTQQLDDTGIFVEIGLEPNSDMVKHLIKLNQNGEVPVNCSCETEIPGLYAAGDVTYRAGKADCDCRRLKARKPPYRPAAIYKDWRNRKM